MIVQTPVIDTLAGLIATSVEYSSLAPGEVAPCAEVRSLELRWIFPGQLDTAVAGWFGRFPARTESREDTYLLDPRLRGLSVKIRGGRALEVKVFCGSPGTLEVAGRARGREQYWQKWSFPLSPPLRAGGGDPAGWRTVSKRRRLSRFVLASGQILAHAPELGQEPGCGVELTEIRTRGQGWWSLGFEATEPPNFPSSTTGVRRSSRPAGGGGWRGLGRLAA